MAGLLDSIIGDDTTKDEYGTTQADRRMPIWSGMIKAGLLALAGGQKMMPDERAQYIAKIGGAVGDVPEQMMAQRSDLAKQALTRQQTVASQQQVELNKQTLLQNQFKMAEDQRMRAYVQTPEFQQSMAGLTPAERAIAIGAANKQDWATVQKLTDPHRNQAKGDANGWITAPGGWLGQTSVFNPGVVHWVVRGTGPEPNTGGAPPGAPPAAPPGATPPVTPPPGGGIPPPAPPPALTGGTPPVAAPPAAVPPGGPAMPPVSGPAVVTPPGTGPAPGPVVPPPGPTPGPVPTPPVAGAPVTPPVVQGSGPGPTPITAATATQAVQTTDPSNPVGTRAGQPLVPGWNQAAYDQLKAQNPNLAEMAKQIVEYRMAMPGTGRGAGTMGLKGKDLLELQQAVTAIGGGKYNVNNMKGAQDVMTAYNPQGKIGSQLANFNILHGHISELYDAFKDLDPGSNQFANKARNFAMTKTGNPEATVADLMTTVVGGEAMKGITGHLTDSEKASWEKPLSSFNSPAQMQKVIESMYRLVDVRDKVYTAAYNATPGMIPRKSFILPELQARADDIKAHPLGVKPQASQQVGTTPDGKPVYRHRDGNTYLTPE